MALSRKDRVQDSTTTTGTGTINLAATAPNGYRSFVSAVTSGDTVRYMIESTDKSEWEVGEGVFTDGSPDTLTRVTVYASSNAGALVNFSAGTKKVSLVLTALDVDILYNTPRGHLLNGKIVVTDTGSGISVAVKTLSGADPSDSNPVYVRIGDTVRSITSALSRSLADGTNWMNAGSAELATREVDYFVYLVWDSNSSAVGLTFSRIPGANLISDFSATTTNNKHCAGYSDFTTTDEVEVIGRFAATLSAGAGYTWTVPTYTAENLIQRPIYDTRWLTWAPTFTGFSVIPTGTHRYQISYNQVKIANSISVAGTSNATSFTFTVPMTSANTMSYTMRWMGADNSAASGVTVVVATNSAIAICYKGEVNGGNTWTAANSKYGIGQGYYEI